MKLPNLSTLYHSLKDTANKKAPEILMACGISGLLAGTVLAVEATVKAVRKKDETDAAKPKEIVKEVWKYYIPAATIDLVAIGCLVEANSIHSKRTAAFAAAYSLSESALKTYQEKVIETVGKKKEQQIRDNISEDRLKREPVKNKEVIITSKGKTLCFDTLSSRYFESDIEKIRQIENTLNKRMISEMYIPLNEFYYELGLPPTKIGDDIGWNVQDDLIDISFSAQLSEDERPCIVLDYRVEPKYDYRSVY